MNEVRILVQSKDDPKNLLSTAEKVEKFHEGLTVVFIESGTQRGQLAIELIIKSKDIYGKDTVVGISATENHWEALTGAFIGARMRFGRMPADQWEMVRHYVKDKARRFIESLDPAKRKVIEADVRKFFGA
jgi:hypothetical protein